MKNKVYQHCDSAAVIGNSFIINVSTMFILDSKQINIMDKVKQVTFVLLSKVG